MVSIYIKLCSKRDHNYHNSNNLHVLVDENGREDRDRKEGRRKGEQDNVLVCLRIRRRRGLERLDHRDQRRDKVGDHETEEDGLPRLARHDPVEVLVAKGERDARQEKVADDEGRRDDRKDREAIQGRVARARRRESKRRDDQVGNDDGAQEPRGRQPVANLRRLGRLHVGTTRKERSTLETLDLATRHRRRIQALKTTLNTRHLL